MKWLAQLENFAAGKPLGECPVCGSEKLEAAFTKVQGDMGFGDIWCDNCHHAFHLSRIRITKCRPESRCPARLCMEIKNYLFPEY